MALITGITGQDGIYLAAFLLNLQTDYDYYVHGIVRKNSLGISLLQEIESSERLSLHYGDTTDSLFVQSLILQIKPNDIYNLAA